MHRERINSESRDVTMKTTPVRWPSKCLWFAIAGMLGLVGCQSPNAWSITASNELVVWGCEELRENGRFTERQLRSSLGEPGHVVLCDEMAGKSVGHLLRDAKWQGGDPMLESGTLHQAVDRILLYAWDEPAPGRLIRRGTRILWLDEPKVRRSFAYGIRNDRITVWAAIPR